MSARRPAGAPDDWGEKGPAGSADEGRRPGHPPPASAYRSGPEEDAPSTAPRAEETGEEGSDVVEDLDALLADVQRERDEYLELARRAKADFENFRKRASRDASDAEKRGKAGLARELVPVVDNLERALVAAGVQPYSNPAAPGREAEEAGGSHSEPRSEEVSPQEALARGLALVFEELQATLARAGVEAYDPVGERFDPAWHEALATRPGDGSEPGTVIETVERGYRLDGQVLRPARVVVSE